MKFTTTLLAVRDMKKSLAFYRELFGQEVVCDFGWNKVLTCGLAMQEHFGAIADFPEEKTLLKPYDMELYFETEDMEGFMALLDTHPEVERLHALKTHPWHQRAVRIFDPDGHIIEVGESMESVGFREFDRGLTVEETAEVTQHPLDVVRTWYGHYLQREQL